MAIFKKGDKIVQRYQADNNGEYVREIVEANKTFYLWKYPTIETVFNSRNSNDVLLDHWMLSPKQCD